MPTDNNAPSAPSAEEVLIAVTHELAASVDKLNGTMATLLGEAIKEPRQLHKADYWWSCLCGHHLAIYNRETDEIRIKTRDTVIFIHLGPKGKITLLCPSCGQLNTQQDTPTS